MTVTLVIIAVLISPVLCAPFIVPFLFRRTERKTLERLREAAVKLPEGKGVDFMWIDVPGRRCEADHYHAASLIACRGPVHEVVERFHARMKTSADAGAVREVAVKVGELCPRCSDFRPGPGSARVLDDRLLYARGADAVLALIAYHARPGLHTAVRKDLPSGD